MGNIYDSVRALFLLPITPSPRCALSPRQTFPNQSGELQLQPLRVPALSKRAAPRARGRAQGKNLKARAADVTVATCYE